MSIINTKIIGFDETAGTILVQFVSDKSKRSIDEYPAIGFSLTNIRDISPQSFIESIKEQISNFVFVRDAIESNIENVDFNTWLNYETSFDNDGLVAPVLTSQLVVGLNNPEVEL